MSQEDREWKRLCKRSKKEQTKKQYKSPIDFFVSEAKGGKK